MEPTIFTFTCDKDGYIEMNVSGEYKTGVPEILYNELCKAFENSINLRAKLNI